MARICCWPLHTFAVLTSVLLILVHKDKNVSFAFSPSAEWRHSSNISYRSVQFRKNLSNNVNLSADPSLVRDQCGIAVESRNDCGRDRSLSQADCEGRGCCYVPQSGLRGPPWCFYPVRYPGYKMGLMFPTEKGQRATLTRSAPSYLPRDIPTLQLDVMSETLGRLHLTLKDPASPRYEVPFVTSQSRGYKDIQNPLYDVDFQPDPFGFIVQRKSNGRVLLNTTIGPLLFADQYLQLSNSMASSVVSGLGEHYTPIILDLSWSSVSLWNRDMAPHRRANLYGSHPFFLVQEGDGQEHGVFLLNSNAMASFMGLLFKTKSLDNLPIAEVFLQPAPALTWVTIGGILDFYIFLGPSPQNVVQQYLEVIL